MLKYIGNGTFAPGVPARDLADEEVRLYGGVVVLVKTGLYERVETKDEVARLPSVVHEGRGQVKPVIKKDTAKEVSQSGQKDGE